MEDREWRHGRVDLTGRAYNTFRVERPEVRYARNGDVSIAYAVLGDGPIDLAWVGGGLGFVGHLEVVWELPVVREFFERLASFARVIVWDKREQGLSDRLGKPPTLEEGMDDLGAVLDAAGSERAALFGISEGGPLSILYAASFPERVTHLVLYGTYARITWADDYPEGLPSELLDRFLEQIGTEWGGPVALKLWAPGAADDEEFVSWWAHLLRSGTSPRAASDLIRMYHQIDVRPALPAVTAPAIVLHRVGDRVALVGWGRALAAAMPSARYIELEGADHLVFLGDADTILDAVEEFITGTRREREPERVLATVLFTDIVGSTERAVAAGDRDWRALLERHDRLVRRQLDRFRGREIKQTGDGFLVVFDGPARAVQCAASIAESAGRLGLQVRAGVHTGGMRALQR